MPFLDPVDERPRFFIEAAHKTFVPNASGEVVQHTIDGARILPHELFICEIVIVITNHEHPVQTELGNIDGSEGQREVSFDEAVLATAGVELVDRLAGKPIIARDLVDKEYL